MKKRIWLYAIVLCLGFVLQATTSLAALVDVKYTETALGDGTWKYEYTFSNKATAGLTLYDVVLNYGLSAPSISSVFSPTGSSWESPDYSNGDGVHTQTYVHFKAPDDGSGDVVAGNSLGSFYVVFTGRLNDPTTFSALLWPGGEGLSEVLGTATPTPIPPALLLFGSGLVGLGFIRRRNFA